MSLQNVASALLLTAFAALGVACGPDYERLEIRGVVGPQGLSGEVSRSRVVVPHGMVVKAHIEALNDDDEQMPLQLRPVNPDILTIEGVVSAHDFAFLGLEPGTTDIDVLADGKKVLVIEAIVTAQPENQ